MGPFDRFNDRAKRVLALAQDEAIRFNHNYIGTEHLLLGLVREGEGVAARVLDSLGVELSKVRTAVEFIIGRGDSTTSPSEITLSPRTRKVIELAIDEARKLGHSHVGTERSEERRVGKECRSRGSPYHERKKARTHARRREQRRGEVGPARFVGFFFFKQKTAYEMDG